MRNISEECGDSTESLFWNNYCGIQISVIESNLTGDYFCVAALDHEEKNKYSKRHILSEVANVYDPLGLLIPCVDSMELRLHDLWIFTHT